jgi:hypothetical protein
MGGWSFVLGALLLAHTNGWVYMPGAQTFSKAALIAWIGYTVPCAAVWIIVAWKDRRVN